MYFHKAQEKPRLWGNFQDRQYAIWDNLEKIYGVDHESEVLVMPLFWGLPLLDYSMYGNHGTNYGATYKDGSLDFDGGDDYVSLGIDATAYNDLSFSLWVKMDANTGDDYIFDQSLGSAGIGCRHDGTTLDFFAWNGGTSGVVNTAVDLSYLRHIEIVHNASGNYVYVDGVKIDETLYDGSDISYGGANLNLGAEYDGSDNFNGIIDEVRISNVARTANQIALFHDNPYGLYQKASRPIWSIPSGLTLTIAAIDSAGLLDSVHLTQKHNLAVQEISGAGSLDNISLSQKHLLVLQELLSSGAIDNVALIQKHILSVQELSGAGTLENVELTQKHILALQDLSSSGTLDNIVLELSTLLVVADLISDGLLDNISLTQKHNLVVQELLSSGELDNITLSISTLLIVAEMISSGALDGVNLTQKHTIAVQELISSGALDDLSLTQKHLLVVQELLSAGAIDNIELLLATLLTVSDMLSAGAIDNTALTQKHILSIDEVLSAGHLDGVSLTQKHLLIIDSLISSGIIDNIRFDIAAGLIYISLSEATEYNISLSEATEYNISLSEATEYNISLSETGGGA